MADVNVRPESIHLAARKVDAAGQDWGHSASNLAADMGAVGNPYGGDELGTALRDMYETIGPTALVYFAETGYCVVETAVAMDQMAEAYTVVDRDTAGQMRRVAAIVDSLGDV